MTLEPQHWLTIGTLLVATVFWFARLEGKVHKNQTEIARMDRQQAAHEAKVEAEARGSRETREALIRMEEQIKHLIDLVERQAPARRKPVA